MRWIGILVLASIAAPDVARSALAAAAGTLYEAAPFAFLADLVPARFGRYSAVFGCGCAGAALPGALAPIALGLCWLSFGPAVAFGRAALALVVAACVRHSFPYARHRPNDGAMHDPFAELAWLGACAAAAAVVLPFAMRFAVTGPERLAAGVLIGCLAPCAAAGVALAAAAAHHAPLVSASILATSGIVPPLRPRVLRPRPARRDARFPAALLGVALAALAVAGPSGLVNPRLVPAIVGGSVLAAISAARARPHAARRASAATVVPGLMLAALVAGAPPPAPNAVDETTIADPYPGETVAFTGVARTEAGAARRTTLVRYVITCCRIDAVPVALPLDRDLPTRDGTWVAVRGVLVARDGALVERADAWHRIDAPHDPFAYR